MARNLKIAAAQLGPLHKALVVNPLEFWQILCHGPQGLPQGLLALDPDSDNLQTLE